MGSSKGKCFQPFEPPGIKVAKKRKLENDDLSLSILTISGSSGSGSAEICTESIKENTSQQPNFCK